MLNAWKYSIRRPAGSAARRVAGVAGLCVSMLLPLTAVAEQVFYRYTNAQGTQVINHSIPPEYAQKGYEVISATGKIVRVVQPVAAGEVAAQREAEKLERDRLAEWDQQLLRRYSRVEEISSAKQRKLTELEGNVAILQSNLRALKLQIVDQQARAADIERSGRAVPVTIIQAIESLAAEQVVTEQQIVLRRGEYEEVAERFDRDIERFREIRSK